MFDNFSLQAEARRQRTRRFAYGVFAIAAFSGGFFFSASDSGFSADLPSVSAVWNGVVGGDADVPPPPAITPPPVPVQMDSSTPPADGTAESIIVKDRVTGAVLSARNEYEPHALASITKLMSAVVLLEHGALPLAATTTVVSDDISDTHMNAGEVYTIDDLWSAGLVASSNKAILSLVDGLGWERGAFVARMNDKAKEIGMANTHFADPTGLDEANVSTASDIAMLLEEALGKQEINMTLLLP
jgi:D-alanyl-D-alanine carboxypeptidase